MPMFDKDLDDVFKRIFKIDVNDYPLHEIPEAIAFYGIRTWDDFVTNWNCDILFLTKAINDHTRVQISQFNQERLLIITNMIYDNKQYKVTDWDLADTYTYIDFFNKAKSVIPSGLLFRVEAAAEVLSRTNVEDASRRDVIFRVVRPAVRRRARLLAGIARDLRRAAAADVLRRAVINVQRIWRGFSCRVQFCKDVIDIKCVQRISRKYLSRRFRTEAVEADLQCARQTQLKALFLARLDAILRHDDVDKLVFADTAKASLTRIGILPVLVRMGSHLTGFSPADSTPTVSPPAEPPPAEPPPVKQPPIQVKMISANAEPRYNNGNFFRNSTIYFFFGILLFTCLSFRNEPQDFNPMRPFTNTEYAELPHVIMSSDTVWDPSIFDNDVDPNDTPFFSANPEAPITYNVSKGNLSSSVNIALIDRGANGIVAEQLQLLSHDEYNIEGKYITAHNTDILASTERDHPVDAVIPSLHSSKVPIFQSHRLPISKSTMLPIPKSSNPPILQSSVPPILKSSLPILKSTAPPIFQSYLPIFKSVDSEQQQLLPLADFNIHGESNAPTLDILASTEQVDPVAAVLPIFYTNDLPIENPSNLPFLKSRDIPIFQSTVHPILQSSLPIFKSMSPDRQQLLPLADSNNHGDYNAHSLDILPSTEQADPVDAVLPNFKSRDLPISNSTELPIFKSSDLPVLGSTDLASAHLSTVQDYGEQVTGRPPDFIYSKSKLSISDFNKQSNEDTSKMDYGEPYSLDGSTTDNPLFRTDTANRQAVILPRAVPGIHSMYFLIHSFISSNDLIDGSWGDLLSLPYTEGLNFLVTSWGALPNDRPPDLIDNSKPKLWGALLRSTSGLLLIPSHLLWGAWRMIPHRTSALESEPHVVSMEISNLLSTPQDYGENITGHPSDFIYSKSKLSVSDSNKQSNEDTNKMDYGETYYLDESTTDDPIIAEDSIISDKEPIYAVLNDTERRTVKLNIIHFHRIVSIPDAQDLECLSDTRSTIFLRFQLFASSKRDSSLLAIITSSTASHALRSFITKDTLLLARGTSTLGLCNETRTLNGLELRGANKFISPNQDDFLLENTSYELDSYFEIWGATGLIDESTLDQPHDAAPISFVCLINVKCFAYVKDDIHILQSDQAEPTPILMLNAPEKLEYRSSTATQRQSDRASFAQKQQSLQPELPQRTCLDSQSLSQSWIPIRILDLNLLIHNHRIGNRIFIRIHLLASSTRDTLLLTRSASVYISKWIDRVIYQVPHRMNRIYRITFANQLPLRYIKSDLSNRIEAPSASPFEPGSRTTNISVRLHLFFSPIRETLLLAQGTSALGLCNENRTLNGIELWGANKFISPKDDDFLLANTSFSSLLPYHISSWGAILPDEEELDLDLDLAHQAKPSPARLIEPTIQIWIEAQSESPIEPQKSISDRLNLIDQSNVFASSNRDTLPLEKTTSTINSSQVRIPNPKPLIPFHRIGSIPDAYSQDVEYLSDTRSTIFSRFQLFAPSKWDSSILAIITSSTASHALRSNVSFVQKGSIILFSIIIMFNDFQTNANKEHALRSFIILSSTAFEWGVLNYFRDNLVNQVKPDMTGWTKSEQTFKRGTMNKCSMEQANTAAVRSSETESAIARVRNWNQSTAINNAEYTNTQTIRNIRKTRQLPSISVYIKKRTTTSLFTFNSN